MTSHSKRKELFVFLLILAVASFFRLYKLDVTAGAIHNGLVDFWSLPLVSAVAGILSVTGLYLLARELFNWQIASLAGFLMAISYWPVELSRRGLKSDLIPLILVFSFYFLWKGLKNNSLINFLLAGIIGGLGFYTDISFLTAPLIAVIVFWNYWVYLKKDFSHSKYESAKIRLLRGFAIMLLAVIIVALPFIYNFWIQGQILKISGPEILSQSQWLKVLLTGIGKTFGMFWFFGDGNPAHGFSGSVLAWPIGILFVIGFINEFIHWVRRKHGHFSSVHTLIFSWFFLMLAGSFISTIAPDALITIGTIPIVMLIAGRGLWWIFDKLNVASEIGHPGNFLHLENKVSAPVLLVMLIFLGSLGFMEYWNYFLPLIKH